MNKDYFKNELGSYQKKKIIMHILCKYSNWQLSAHIERQRVQLCKCSDKTNINFVKAQSA